ncbi:YdiU family protein [Sulfurimonas sediminis]|uniref:Protein nucleotidyltransferase YdiU n=1 Tax=Sulfurimonas sediminis TaxID=2590020 RepID=A0A7M1AZ81_9BACT|nr:YdiU family protein [Sulfurimonas sediminis]QOP42753.1 YdiU family protein [Sulfurimonas sediminis]
MKFSDLQLTTPYLALDTLFYDRVEPTPLEKPFLVAASQDAAKLLGIDEDVTMDEALVKIVNAEMKLKGSQSFAMCYAGHQFGCFVPRLGDGRAVNLGKVNGQNLQLKGAGTTLYSRQGDGRAVLRSSIREFLMSEAMHGLGISTSRALALIGSDTDVPRERWEKGAIVLRLCPTWVRFGTFEYFSAAEETQKLQQLADYVIDESYPELKNEEDKYLKMYEKAVQKSAKTVAKWQAYGFNHGVLNTDNMAIDGSTIDYGPFAFLDIYDPNYVCNRSDTQGRYSFRGQPGIVHWNLSRLALALTPLINHDAALEVLEDTFGDVYETEYTRLMYKRMGLQTKEEKDLSLLKLMLRSLEQSVIDYNVFFRKLSVYQGKRSEILELAVYKEYLERWLDTYDARVKKESFSDEQRHKNMLHVNPKYILKNHILQEAVEKAQKNDFSMVNDLLRVALAPFDEHPELEYLAKPTPQSAKNLKLSCSS